MDTRDGRQRIGRLGKQGMTTERSPARLSGNEQIVEHALGEVRTFIDELKNGTSGATPLRWTGQGCRHPH